MAEHGPKSFKGLDASSVLRKNVDYAQNTWFWLQERNPLAFEPI